MTADDMQRLHESLGATSLHWKFLGVLWLQFSNDQDATDLAVDEISVRRFRGWLESGNPADARS